MSPRRVVIVAFDDVQSLDITGPSEVFSLAGRTAPAAEYTLELVAPRPGELRTSSGLRLLPHAGLDDCNGPIDTLIAPARCHPPLHRAGAGLQAHRDRHARARRRPSA